MKIQTDIINISFLLYNFTGIISRYAEEICVVRNKLMFVYAAVLGQPKVY